MEGDTLSHSDRKEHYIVLKIAIQIFQVQQSQHKRVRLGGWYDFDSIRKCKKNIPPLKVPLPPQTHPGKLTRLRETSAGRGKPGKLTQPPSSQTVAREIAKANKEICMAALKINLNYLQSSPYLIPPTHHNFIQGRSGQGSKIWYKANISPKLNHRYRYKNE